MTTAQTQIIGSVDADFKKSFIGSTFSKSVAILDCSNHFYESGSFDTLSAKNKDCLEKVYPIFERKVFDLMRDKCPDYADMGGTWALGYFGRKKTPFLLIQEAERKVKIASAYENIEVGLFAGCVAMSIAAWNLIGFRYYNKNPNSELAQFCFDQFHFLKREFFDNPNISQDDRRAVYAIID